MSHEATHVATGAPLTSGVPLWLLEGFADYVALHDVDLPIDDHGRPDHPAGAPRRRSGPPARASPSSTRPRRHLGAAYESAWVACLVLADAGGQEALVRLYERVSRGGELAGPLQSLFGLTEAQLTQRWRERLRDLAAASTDGT